MLLDPDARRGAFGSANGVVVFVTSDEAGDEASEFRGPLVYPSFDVPGDPGPCGADLVRLDRAFAVAGCPVFVRVAPGRVELMSFHLKLAGADVETVPYDGAAVGMPGLHALVPKAPLRPATKYEILVETKADGRLSRRRYDFRTGEK